MVRPFQHVLVPLFAYLMVGAAQLKNPEKAGNYNIGPEDEDCVSVRELASLFCRYWGEGAEWEEAENHEGPHEDRYLKLDCSRLKGVLQHVLWAKTVSGSSGLSQISIVVSGGM